MSLPHTFFAGRAGGAEGPLYNFTSFTFSEPDSGRYGTSFATLQSRYSGQPFMDEGFLVEGAFTGYHRFTIPRTGTYEFEAAGAPGTRASGGYNGGYGIKIRGQIYLSAGEEIQFAIGKSGGEDSVETAGGGGGTFIVKQAFFEPGGAVDSNIILVAGGGAGGAYDAPSASSASFGKSGVDGEENPGSGGVNGNGGDGNGLAGNSGAAGPASGIYSAGFNFNYANSSQAEPSEYFLTGNSGGAGYYNAIASGFGGSGAAGNYAGGPGGGYSGGGGGRGNGYRSGGGGSFHDNLSNVVNLGEYGSPNFTNPEGGFVKITAL